MKIQADCIDLHQVQNDAEDSYRQGFFCCEAVMETIIRHFRLDVPLETVRLASGMAIGVGQSGCICGALNGGVLAIGLFFGRSQHNGPQDPAVIQCMALSKELHDWFKANNGKNAVCCRILTREFDMRQGQHKAQCIYYTGLCAAKTAAILARELHIPATGEIRILTHDQYLQTPTSPQGA
ncbi:MAG: C-GCAxxG-C-C family protein [Firmicutes bacterium]|nr:C-GCAxxG-C-C family protein [Bacillota bacterium]